MIATFKLVIFCIIFSAFYIFITIPYVEKVYEVDYDVINEDNGSNLCPEPYNWLTSTDYCYSINTNITYTKCPYNSFFFDEDVNIHLNLTSWVPANRTSTAEPFTINSIERFGENIRHYDIFDNQTGNCLIYDPWRMLYIATDCAETNNLLCLYKIHNFRTGAMCWDINNTTETLKSCVAFDTPLNENSSLDVCKDGDVTDVVFDLKVLDFKVNDSAADEAGINCWIRSYETPDETGVQIVTSEIVDNYTNLHCSVCQKKMFDYKSKSKGSYSLAFSLQGSAVYGYVTKPENMLLKNAPCFYGGWNKVFSRKIYPFEKFDVIMNATYLPSYLWCENVNVVTNAYIKSSQLVMFHKTFDVINEYAVYIITVYQSESNDSFVETNFTHAISEDIKTKICAFSCDVRPMHLDYYDEFSGAMKLVYHISHNASFETVDEEQSWINASVYQNFDDFNATMVVRAAFCRMEVVEYQGVTLIFEETGLKKTVAPNNCSELPVMRKCEGNFTMGAFWANVTGTYRQCKPGLITDTIFNLRYNNDTDANRITTLLDASNTLGENATTMQLHYAALAIEKIAKLENMSMETTDDTIIKKFVEIVDNLIAVKRTVLRDGQYIFNSTDMILYGLDNFLGTFKTEFSFDLKYLKIRRTNITSTSNIIGWSVDDNNNLTQITRGATVDDILNNKPKVASFLPDEILLNIDYYSNFKDLGLLFIFFKKNSLFGSTTSLTEWVIGITLPGYNAIFKTTFPVIINPGHDGYYTYRCGYWDYGLNQVLENQKGSWVLQIRDDEDGDPIIQDMLVCYYNHLTHFTMLIFENSFDSLLLSILTIIGAVFSLLGVIFIFVRTILSKGQRSLKSIIILLNFLFSILMLPVVMFISNYVENEKFCHVIGMLLHYFLLSQFSWTLIISYYQYRRFVVIFNNHYKRVILKTCLLGWVGPAIPVIIIAAIDINKYHRTNTQLCYLSGLDLQLGVLLPAMIIITINFVFFIKIMLALVGKKRRSFGSKSRLYVDIVKLAFFLCFLLGLTWIFGLIVVLSGSIFFTYLFSVTTSLQGLVVALNFIHAFRFNWCGFIYRKFAGNSEFPTESTTSTKIK